ncbi:hypothetical protein Q4303_15540 [Acinetobacter baumannii]
MDKFEEAWKQNRHVWESTKNLAKAMYLAGEEAQQAKVEELQKRVDKAIRLLVKAELYQSEPNIDLAVKALKGEGQ